ncbi:membrane hypothetical protein [Candidatus Magnetomoraceae bacterium gMMP-1]
MLKSLKDYPFIYYWLPVFLYCAAIFIQSSYPAPEQIPSIVNIDKFLHFFAYGLMGMLFLRGFKGSRFQNRMKLILIISILLTGIYGASDELHQSFVSCRDGNIWDAIADFLGGVFGVFFYKWIIERYPVIKKI